MAIPKPKPRLTVDQYLAFERAAQDRHFYLDGEVFAMAGESDDHGVIAVNIVASLHGQLRGKPCGVRSKDIKVGSGLVPARGSSTSGAFSYPDVLVVCGEPEYHDAHRDILLNPTVIIEVLSRSTEAFDRGEKFKRYQVWNPTLTDYLLVSQNQPEIEHFKRTESGSWTYTLYSGLDACVAISSIECQLALNDVYERITLPPPDHEEPA